MKLKALLAGLALLWASPAFADNFVFQDALGNFVVLPCTTANGVCTPTVSSAAPAESDVDIIKFGNTAVTLGQKAMTASMPVVLPSDQAAVPLWGQGATGAAVPAGAQYNGVNVGGNLTGETRGTAGTAATQVMTVQGIASMTPVQVSQATASNLNATVTDGAGALNVIVDSGTLAATQSGTWTVQPGNTPNTTAWLTQTTPSSAAAAAVANVVSTAVETGRIIKGSAGNLWGWSVTTGAVAGRVLVHNTTTVPTAGAVTPVDCAIVPANSTVAMTYQMPLRLGTGISLSFSTATTCFTQTDSATAYFAGQAS